MFDNGKVNVSTVDVAARSRLRTAELLARINEQIGDE
jgi:hypothetical protein